MAKAKYNTAQHKALATQYAQDIANGNGWCVEPNCIMTTRHIPPGTPRKDWHVPHNEDGITYRPGPAHAPCNVDESLRRRHRRPTNRWVV